MRCAGATADLPVTSSAAHRHLTPPRISSHKDASIIHQGCPDLKPQPGPACQINIKERANLHPLKWRLSGRTCPHIMPEQSAVCSDMRKTIRQAVERLPAVVLLLIFVSSWSAVPARLMLPDPVTCGMSCCLDNGACCCFEMRTAARLGIPDAGAHQHHDEDAAAAEVATSAVKTPTGTLAATLTSSCPPQCAKLPSLPVLSLFKTTTPEYALAVEATPAGRQRAPHFPRDALPVEIYSPRAPPSSFL
jgi:hypothetical protein